MTADILYLQNFRPTPCILSRDENVTDPNTLIREKAALITEALDQEPTIGLLAQRIILAKNLWKILDDLEQSGTRKTDVVREAALGSSISSTKPLYNYTLDPKRSDQEDDHSLDRRLIKKSSKYLKLLKAAATRSGISYDRLLIHFVAGSKYDVSLDSDTRLSETAAYRDVANFLNDLGQTLEGKYKLTEFYQYVRTRRVEYDPSANRFQKSMLNSFFSQEATYGEWIGSDASVLRFGPFLHLYDRCELDFLEADINIYEQNSSVLKSVRTNMHIYSRVFLGLLPVGLSEKAELCLVEEIHTDVHNPEGQTELPASFYGWPGVEQPQRMNPVIGRLDCAFDVQLKATSGRRLIKVPPKGGCRTTVHQITAAACKQLLQYRDDGQLEFGSYDDFSLLNEGTHLHTGHSNCPAGSIAEIIDLDLHREDVHNRFDMRLVRRIEHLWGALRRSIKEIDDHLSHHRENVLNSHRT